MEIEDIFQYMNNHQASEARFHYIQNILFTAAKYNHPEILKQICTKLEKHFTKEQIAQIIEENVMYLKIPLEYCIENNDRNSCIILLKLGAHIPDSSNGKILIKKYIVFLSDLWFS